MEKMEFHRKDWNQRHAAIRRILMKEKDYRKALPLLLKHHAAVHSSKLGARWSFQDEVLGALTEDQMRIAPKGGQSAVWKLWHATRVEDVTMNVLLAGSKQVLTSGGWLKKLGVKVTDVGNDMPKADLARLDRRMNIKALLSYRLAVGKRTQRILRLLDSGTLWEKPAPERIRRLEKEKAVRPKAKWLLKFWGGNPRANLLLMPAARHPFVHLNEIRRMTPALRKAKKKQ
jgi:hypothetical protein